MKNTSENGVGDGRPVCLKIAPRKRGHRRRRRRVSLRGRRRRAGDVNRASLPPAMHRCLAAVAAAPPPRTLFRGTNERTNEKERQRHIIFSSLFPRPPARRTYVLVGVSSEGWQPKRSRQRREGGGRRTRLASTSAPVGHRRLRKIKFGFICPTFCPCYLLSFPRPISHGME